MRVVVGGGGGDGGGGGGGVCVCVWGGVAFVPVRPVVNSLSPKLLLATIVSVLFPSSSPPPPTPTPHFLLIFLTDITSSKKYLFILTYSCHVI